MPDPSEPGPQRPERPEETPPAPDRLRRRVLAGLHAEPEPVGSLAAHRMRRPILRRRLIAVVSLLLGTGGVLALVVVFAGGGSSTPGSARLARNLVRVDGHAELRLAGMPQPPIGEVYEIWLTRAGSGPAPTNALFTPTSAGTATVLVPGSLHRVREITVTAEPVGGSATPTSAVILSVALSPRAAN